MSNGPSGVHASASQEGAPPCPLFILIQAMNGRFFMVEQNSIHPAALLMSIKFL